MLKEGGKCQVILDPVNLPACSAVELGCCGNLADHSDLVNRDADPKDEGREAPGTIPLHFPFHILYFRVENVSEKVKGGVEVFDK